MENPEPQKTILEAESQVKERMAHGFRNLRELVDHVSGRDLPPPGVEEGGKTEPTPFPFLAIVGQ
ncbi:MAG: hypothetical protein FJZ96_08955, partial [Chloroflexi bacterium]|nr:hypothetical protein [Chloroflexota bacterium]